jgi:acetoin utilization deacetylase AcuC-like enzyme
MTLSFHEFDKDFFPGTGDYTSIGEDEGRGYSINVPLKRGITDEMYIDLFKYVINEVIGHYNPEIIIL